MHKGIFRNLLLLVLLLVTCNSLYASTEHFWLLQEYGIEKRAMEDGSLIQNFSSLTKPLAFSVKPKQNGIWAIADGFLVSFNNEGSIVNSVTLNNINQNAYLLSMPEDGVWLFHGSERYTYDEELTLTSTLELPLDGNQINDVSYSSKEKKCWITTSQSVIAIDDENNIASFSLEKNERLNGITITKEGNVALVVATPKAELRLYTSDFQHIVKHSLEKVNPVPDNVAETKDGKFWLAGKQHILLVDTENGVEINYEHNGEIPQGPTESQLINVPKDNSAWVSIGRNLLHIDTRGFLQNQRQENERLIDVGVEGIMSTPPTLTPAALTRIPYYPFFGGDPDTGNGNGNSSKLRQYQFTLTATGSDSDIDYSNVELEYNNKKFNIDLTYNEFSNFGQGVLNIENNPFLCYRGRHPYVDILPAESLDMFPWIMITDDNQITCFEWIMLEPIDTFSSTPQINNSNDELRTIRVRVNDKLGNASNDSIITLEIDRTPPEINHNLISSKIDTINHTATIIGADGSVTPGSKLIAASATSSHRLSDGVTSNESGAFSLTIPIDNINEWLWRLHYGDSIKIYAYDEHYNTNPDPAVLKIGHAIELTDIKMNSDELLKFGRTIWLPDNKMYSDALTGWSLTATPIISGIHNMEGSGTITAKYWGNNEEKIATAFIRDNTFTIEGVVFSDITPQSERYIKYILIEARDSNRGYGYTLVKVNIYIDTTPPPIPTLWGPFVEHADGYLTISCNEAFAPCAEPGSTLHITNNSNNKSVSVDVDENGLFTATIAGEIGSSFTFIAEDAAGNTSQPLQRDIGRIHSLDLHISDTTYYRTREFGQISVTISPYASQESTVTINGVTATPQEGYAYRYIAHDVTIGEDNKVTAIYKDQYGGYGRVEMDIRIDATPLDTTPPDKARIELLDISTEEYGFYYMTCADGCAEPGSLILVKDLSTGVTTFAYATETGSFTARSYSSKNQRLRITVEDQAQNQSMVEILINYDIDIVINSPKNGDIINAGKVFVTGYHNGPPNSVVSSYYGTGELVTNGNNFSGYAEIHPAKVHLGIQVDGPLNGGGLQIISLKFTPPPPNTELIEIRSLPEYEGEYVDLIGAPGTTEGYSNLIITNDTTNHSGWLAPDPDGSFEFTVPARNGDILSLYSASLQGYQSDSVTLPVGRLVDLAVTSHQSGSVVGSQPITVTGTHTGPETSTITVNGITAQVTAGEFIASNVTVGSDGILNIRLDSYTDAYGIATIQLENDATPPEAPNLSLIDTVFSVAQSVWVTGQLGSVEGGAILTITNTAQNESKTLTVVDDGSFSTYIPGLPGETLTLVAADAVGNQSDSATLQLGTEAMITIEAPLQGSTVPALQLDGSNSLTGLVTVTGSHAGPVNSGIVVNGVIAAVTADRFVALNVPVSTDGILTAKLTALDGSHGSNQISVGLLEQPHLLSLTPSSTEGVAPHSVNFKWNAYTTETPGEVSIDYDGDGTFDQSSSDLTTPLQHDYTVAAINNVTLRVTMADGSQYTKGTAVVTHGSEHYDAIFLSLWNGMNEALLANQPGIALKYLTPPAQLEYAKTFQVIAPHMQAIIDSYGPAARSDIKRGYLEYIVERTYPDSIQAHYIYSLQGKDGMWRLSTM